MKLTPEQENIIHSRGDIKINAVAGSGKTTTIIEYARSRPTGSSILYLAFNRSVKVEAEKKFAEKKLDHVHIETAHSLAFKYIVRGNNYRLKQGSYKTHEIVELLKLPDYGEKHTEYVIANHINKFLAYFCNSDKQKVRDLNYLDIVVDPQAAEFVKRFYKEIEQQTRLFLKKMDDKQIEITHDFYLKKFQLSDPALNYDYILFDEGQDASVAMLDVFLKQKATKVIVGDTHQQIYGWRYAVNSLERVGFKTLHLSTSFRFRQDIADFATDLLDWKSYLGEHDEVSITGKGTSKELKTKAMIGRTNLGLLVQAIQYVSGRKDAKRIYFEGNFNSYTYAEDGASLYDVLNLYNGKRILIRDKMIRSMKDMHELEEYIEKTEDAQLGTMVDLVKDYGNTIPGLISKIKDLHVDDDEKEKADMIFSTVHRCKGMEYDTVYLANDFLKEDRLQQAKTEVKEEGTRAKLIEEINLLYVAVTRARNTIYVHDEHLPVGVSASASIRMNPIKVGKPDPKPSKKKQDTKARDNPERSYSVETERESHQNAYMPWTDLLDEILTTMYIDGKPIADIALALGRKKGAVYSRIVKLRLEGRYE